MSLPKQIWIDGHDAAGILTQIGDWQVGSPYHQAAKKAVDYLLRGGLVSYRTCVAPAIPEGILGFEVTDKGLVRLREWGLNADYAERERQAYRDLTVHL